VCQEVQQVFQSALESVKQFLQKNEFNCASVVLEGVERLRKAYPEDWAVVLNTFPPFVRHYVRSRKPH
jgi:hypothetical protein